MRKKYVLVLLLIYGFLAMISAISLLCFYEFWFDNDSRFAWFFFNWYQSFWGLTITGVISLTTCIVIIICIIKKIKIAPQWLNITLLILSLLNFGVYTLGWFVLNFYSYFA
ncbi:hypothetical protein RBH29_17795 [Herbivorax sp. ANBcel31]|uniref:hypothetical protein n=1 Tax=Herbivorax sp. ANBcel31 TaxID=3069754 RepID=UPI0027ADB69B|nr:hypothetical protein [Herbivorax sp. ANBcel31]MDQ2088279.1 hypothetical protein [Herbivorax sp. ANBcel31]